MQKPLIDVENEMVRLNTNLLEPIPQVLCDSKSHLTIAFLNVRSLVSKLSDIISDKSLNAQKFQVLLSKWTTPSLLYLSMSSCNSC